MKSFLCGQSASTPNRLRQELEPIRRNCKSIYSPPAPPPPAFFFFLLSLAAVHSHARSNSSTGKTMATASPAALTAWPSVQLCTPVRHREVAGRRRDTWQTCAWGRSPGRVAPRGRCKDRLGWRRGGGGGRKTQLG